MIELLAALAIAAGSWQAIPGGTWVPEGSEVEAARSQLEPYVARQARLSHETLPTWESYTFQYQGRELYGQKVIYVNAFCSAPPPHADTQMVAVLDGGPCYFQAYWDPANKIFLSVLFNGQA